MEGLSAGKRGDHMGAYAAFKRAEAVSSSDRLLSRVKTLQAAALLRAGRPDEALTTAEQAETLYRRTGEEMSEQMTQTLAVRRQALSALGRDAEAALVNELIAARTRASGQRETVTRDPPPSEAIPHGTVAMQFAPEVGPFSLRRVVRFRGDGSDMAGTYRASPQNGRRSIELTAYVTRGRVSDLRSEFAQTASVIKIRYSDVERVTPPIRVEVDAEDGTKLTGIGQSYAHTDRTVGTDLYMFQARDAVVKFRISYAAADFAEVRAAIDKFIAAFDWPPVDGSGARVDVFPGADWVSNG